MHTPHDPTNPCAAPADKRRRMRLFAISGTAVTFIAAAGVTYVLIASKSSAPSVPNLVQIGSESTSQLGVVSGHFKNQAYGPNWSLHRLIEIAEYLRGTASTA
jgi:hypothetical protein